MFSRYTLSISLMIVYLKKEHVWKFRGSKSIILIIHLPYLIWLIYHVVSGFSFHRFLCGITRVKLFQFRHLHQILFIQI